jgi:sortase (surface protein transpeptidase)
MHKDGIRYTYKIYDKKVVSPDDVSVLGPAAKTNSVTLITCDPPGTSVNRLIIVAEQISPDPAGNTEAEINIDPADTIELPSNAPSLWSRLTSWL